MNYNEVDQRAVLVEQALRKLGLQREELLDLYLSGDGLPKEMLQERMANLGHQRDATEREAEQLKESIAAQPRATENLDEVRATCTRAIAAIEWFNFEDERRALEKSRVTGVVERGDTPEEDRVYLRRVITAAQELDADARNCGHIRSISCHNLRLAFFGGKV